MGCFILHGINVVTTKHKLLLYANDILSTPQEPVNSLQYLKKNLDEFNVVSGLIREKTRFKN